MANLQTSSASTTMSLSPTANGSAHQAFTGVVACASASPTLNNLAAATVARNSLTSSKGGGGAGALQLNSNPFEYCFAAAMLGSQDNSCK